MTRFMIVQNGDDTWPERWDQDPKLCRLKRMHSVGLTQLGRRENVPETFSSRSLASRWCLNLRIKYPEHETALRKLSCLGNGEKPGNSTGNLIAQEALRWENKSE